MKEKDMVLNARKRQKKLARKAAKRCFSMSAATLCLTPYTIHSISARPHARSLH
jgi:hypothetical protein